MEKQEAVHGMTPDQYKKALNERLTNYAKPLEGISYLDWKRLSHSIGRMFETQKNEHERHLKLVLTEGPGKFSP